MVDALALACAACFTGEGGATWGYYLATALLVAVPSVGGVLFVRWVRRALASSDDDDGPTLPESEFQS